MFKPLKLDLQLFAEEAVPEPESSSVEDEVTEPSVETSDAGTAPPSDSEQEEPETKEDDVTKQESFAKRLQEQTEKKLAEARQKWEQEQAERLKEYEVYKRATEYLKKHSGIDDLQKLAEEIELAELQERAATQEIPVEVQKRLDELEAKAKQAEEYERERQKQEQVNIFKENLTNFVKDKGVEVEALWTFMADNNLPYDPDDPEKYFTIAYKAMKADELEAKLENAKKEAVKEYLESKKAPKAEGGGALVVQNDAPKTWEEARERALARLKAANRPE